MIKNKKTLTVDLVCCTVISCDGRVFSALSFDKKIYRFEVKKGSVCFDCGDMVWIYRADKEHLVIDYAPYKNNEHLLNFFNEYEVEV